MKSAVYLTARKELRIQWLGKTDNAIGFDESHSQMEQQTGFIIQFAIAGEFGASQRRRPCFAGTQQCSCAALPAEFRSDINSFQVSDGTGFSSLYIITAKLALCKANSVCFIEVEENGTIRR